MASSAAAAAAAAAAGRSASSPDAVAQRFQCTDQEYLDQHGVRAHLADALSIVSQAPGKLRPLECLAIYFTSLSDPSSVCHRPFSYVNSSASTRRSFISVFRSSFLSSGDGSGSGVLEPSAVNAQAVHELCCLLCADFPFSLVRNAARITNDTPTESSSSGGAAGSSLPQPALSLASFSHKVFVLFLFSEFLNQCALAFRALDTQGVGRVNRARFHRRIQAVLEKHAHDRAVCCPPAQAIHDTLGPAAATRARTTPAASQREDAAANADADGKAKQDEQVQFNQFCVALFAHPLIAQALLPQE